MAQPFLSEDVEQDADRKIGQVTREIVLEHTDLPSSRWSCEPCLARHIKSDNFRTCRVLCENSVDTCDYK